MTRVENHCFGKSAHHETDTPFRTKESNYSIWLNNSACIKKKNNTAFWKLMGLTVFKCSLFWHNNRFMVHALKSVTVESDFPTVPRQPWHQCLVFFPGIVFESLHGSTGFNFFFLSDFSERETLICCSTYAFIGWFSCALTGDRTCNLGISGYSNQLSHPARASFLLFLMIFCEMACFFTYPFEVDPYQGSEGNVARVCTKLPGEGPPA